MLNAPVPVLLTVTDADGRASVASRTRASNRGEGPTQHNSDLKGPHE